MYFLAQLWDRIFEYNMELGGVFDISAPFIHVHYQTHYYTNTHTPIYSGHLIYI